MDTPFNQTNQNTQPSTGFAFPVTTVVDPADIPVPPAANPVPPPPSAPLVSEAPIGETTVPASDTSQVTVNVMSQPVPPSPQAEPVPMGSTGSPQAVQPVPPLSGINITEQKPKSKTKDILLVGLLLILLAGAVFGFTKVRSLLSSAAEDSCTPIDIVEQDLTANSIVINFKTAEACKMQVAYGVDEILGLQMSEQILATDHRVKLSPLMPSTPYKYQIRHDETKYEPTRGFLTLPVAVVPTKEPAVAVPTRNLTPVMPTPKPTGLTTPVATQSAGSAPTGTVKYTITDFQLHFGSVDPRFDTDKNGIVNIRDWQLYSK